MIALVFVAGISAVPNFCMAGYRTITPTSGIEIYKSVEPVKTWEAKLWRENGKQIQFQNLGDRFASEYLNAGEKCKVIMTVPGLNTGSEVKYFATHGGKINEKVNGVIPVKQEGEVDFEFTIGNEGPHPVHVAIDGYSKTFLFQIKNDFSKDVNEGHK